VVVDELGCEGILRRRCLGRPGGAVIRIPVYKPFSGRISQPGCSDREPSWWWVADDELTSFQVERYFGSGLAPTSLRAGHRRDLGEVQGRRRDGTDDWQAGNRRPVT
jgi:hypothetical protein